MKTNGYKILRCCFIIIGTSLISLKALCQKPDCFEIKYLDYFGLQTEDSIPINITEWQKLLDNKIIDEDKKGTLFFIPFIVSTIKSYHPLCNAKKDTAIYNVLASIYCRIRGIDIGVLQKRKLADQLEFFRDDFYQQVQNDSLLPYLKYTLDDGPFYGKDTTYTKAKDNQAFLTDFGNLVISKCSKNEACITVMDQNGTIRWTKKMLKTNGQVIQNITLNKQDIYKTSLGYTILMAGDGERLTLYLKDNGDFRFFFHSW